MRVGVLFLGIALCGSFGLAGGAFAQSKMDEGSAFYNRFDGSEFQGRDFRDTTLDQENYNEEGKARRRGEASFEQALSARKRLLLPETRKSLEDARPKRETKSSAMEKREGLSGEEHIPPVYDLPGDWVPDKIDLTSNGAFGTIPDNGSPVPYTLNGHPDIERGRPYE